MKPNRDPKPPMDRQDKVMRITQVLTSMAVVAGFTKAGAWWAGLALALPAYWAGMLVCAGLAALHQGLHWIFEGPREPEVTYWPTRL